MARLSRTICRRSSTKFIRSVKHGKNDDSPENQSYIDRTRQIKRNPDFSTRFMYSSVRKHYLFFEVRDDTLFLATIFHGVMNIKERLAEEMDEIQRELEESSDE